MRKFLIRTSNNDSIDGEMDVKCEKENGSYKQLSKQKVQTHEKGDTSLIDERECANHFRQESPNDKKNESWDSIQRMNNSFSTVESSTTINTLRHFGLSNHPGKSVDNVIIDAFMDLQDENESHSKHRNLSKVGNLKPYNVDSKHDVLLHRALSCIAKRDFKQLMSIVEATPAILLCPCKKNNEINDSLDDRYQTRGCYGGTILHVLASQKPSLKKKRVNGNKSMKDRLTNALSFSQKDIYELHIMPSVPPTILSHIIKMEPNALQMIDDIGRLPIHCATLSQSIHLGEINKILTSPKTTNLDTKSSYEISRIIVREINLTDILIRHYREGAYVSDLKGNLPIHYAASMGPDYSESENIIFQKEEKFRKPSAMNTISQLIEVFPKSLEIPNKEGNLPIHMACARGSGINLSVLEILVSHHNTTKDILSKKNNNGDPPLFVAIKSRIAVDVVFTFASHEIGATTVKFIFSQRDASNNNLLQVALQLIPSCDSNLIAAIMKVAPFTASTTDSKGVMPIR
jgi:ankyrin repeat protein